MSERDLPSRVLSEQNHNTSTLNGGRNILPPHAPIHSSKSVPSLNSKYSLATNLLLGLNGKHQSPYVYGSHICLHC